MVNVESCISRDNKGHLTIEKTEVKEMCEKFGTPLFLVCERHIKENYIQLRDAFLSQYSKVAIAYSYKTNYLPAICAILDKEGAWAEVVSLLELSIARSIHVNPNKIIFNGPAKSDEELLEAARSNLRAINIDSLSELQRLIHLTNDYGLEANVGIRLRLPPENTQLNKFGVDVDSGQAFEACRIIANSKNLNFVGLHVHLGTQIMKVEPFIGPLRYMMEFAASLYENFGLQTEIIDIGGGFPAKNIMPIHTLENAHTPSIEAYASAVCSIVSNESAKGGIKRPLLVAEPGRAIISSPIFLLTKVVAIKSVPRANKLIIVDAGLNLLPEAEYYKYGITPALIRSGKLEKIDIGGPLCMKEDFIALDMELPPLAEGDILAILDAGAYSISLSWQFIKPRPAVCLIRENGTVEVIRKSETIDDILKLDIIPSKLMTT